MKDEQNWRSSWQPAPAPRDDGAASPLRDQGRSRRPLRRTATVTVSSRDHEGRYPQRRLDRNSLASQPPLHCGKTRSHRRAPTRPVPMTIDARICLAETLRHLLPSDVACAAGPIAAAQGPLFAAEEAALIQTAETRRREFGAGRHHARTALRQLGCPDRPIPRAEDRRPLWPGGYVGAISHSRNFSAAIAAPASAYLGLGLDLELATPLEPEHHRFIARPEERAALAKPIHTPEGRLDRAKLVFSAKEALFKAVYPITRQWFGFQEATLEIDPATYRFTACLHIPGLPHLHGCWTVAEGHVLTTVTLPHPPMAPPC